MDLSVNQEPVVAHSALWRLGDWLSELVSGAFRARLVRRAYDGTSALVPGSALVLAPHADDETLGCSVLMMRKHEAGFPVRVIIATDGSRSHTPDEIPTDELIAVREAESREAAARLGLSREDVRFLGHPDGRLFTEETALRDELMEAIREFAPDQVFSTSIFDKHTDHRTLARAARAATETMGFGGELYEYPVTYWLRLPWTRRTTDLVGAVVAFFCDPVAEFFRAPRIKLSTEGYLTRKRAALDAHHTQVANLPNVPAGPYLNADFLRHFLQPFEIFARVRPRK